MASDWMCHGLFFCYNIHTQKVTKKLGGSNVSVGYLIPKSTNEKSETCSRFTHNVEYLRYVENAIEYIVLPVEIMN